jgi:hypothetical protein
LNSFYNNEWSKGSSIEYRFPNFSFLFSVVIDEGRLIGPERPGICSAFAEQRRAQSLTSHTDRRTLGKEAVYV